MKSFMIAGTHSGCGKSTIAMGLNRLLTRSGYKVQPWKCGPDYIDPGFHTIAAGRPCRNLDTRLMSEKTIDSLLSYHGNKADISLVEGVMGFFDGDAGRFEKGSSCHLARVLDMPVILVLDVRSMAQSAAALARGFLDYKSNASRPSPIAGFIVNRVGSQRHYSMVKDAIEEETGLPVLGGLPRKDGISLPERHLGLVLAEEQEEFLSETLDKIADLLEESLDMDKILEIASSRSTGKEKLITDGQPYLLNSENPEIHEDSPLIAVARDEAFAFYYQDNLDLLENRGGRLAFFSPLRDKAIPEGCSAVYLGGGYPERFLKTLSDNQSMAESLKQAAYSGMPIYGECGGYMYLSEQIKDEQGTIWPMLGLLPCRINMTSSLKALGYGDVHWMKDSFLAPQDTVVAGHLFHWSQLEADDESEYLFCMKRDKSDIEEGMMKRNVIASYVHFHFATHPFLAENIVEAARNFKLKQDEK